MDIGSAGVGAGGGLLATIITHMVIKYLDHPEKDMEKLQDKVVFKDVHNVCQAATLRTIEEINRKLDRVLDKLER